MENCRQSGFLPRYRCDIIETFARGGQRRLFHEYLPRQPKVRKPHRHCKNTDGNMEFHGVWQWRLLQKALSTYKRRMWRKALAGNSDQGLDSLVPDVGEGRKVLIEFVSSNRPARSI